MIASVPVIAMALAALVLAGGCIPYRQTVATGFETRLVDARSGAPVGGALVSLRTTRTDRAEVVSAMSSPDGLVKVGPIARRLWLPLLPVTLHPLPGEVRIEADGYRTIDALETYPSASDEQSTWLDVAIDRTNAETLLEPEE